MGVYYYLLATTQDGHPVARLNFFHLGMGMKMEEFQESGKNESAGYPTSSYEQLVDWIKSISPPTVTWEIVSEYAMDEYPKGIKDIGLEPLVRAKAIELGYTNQEFITLNDNIMVTPLYDLDGNIRPRSPSPPPLFPHLEFDDSGTLQIQTDTFNVQTATRSMDVTGELSQSIIHPVLDLAAAEEEVRYVGAKTAEALVAHRVQDAAERKEIVDLTEEAEEYVLLQFKSRHENTIYALPTNQAATYLRQVLNVGPMKARLARQKKKYKRSPLATTLEEEMDECAIVSLNSGSWEICQTRSPCEGVEVGEDTTLPLRHRPPTEWSIFHPDVYPQKAVSDWLADNAFTCGNDSNFYIMARRCDPTRKLTRVDCMPRKRRPRHDGGDAKKKVKSN